MSQRGAKSWIQRLNIQGLRTDNAIGQYPMMGLAEARAIAFERWKIAKAGGDPRRANGKSALAPTFAEAAKAVITMHKPTWRSHKSEAQWRASLEAYVFPAIGKLPVSDITPAHVMDVLQPMWNEKRETAALSARTPTRNYCASSASTLSRTVFARASGCGRPSRPTPPHAVMEAALAHTIRNQAEAAYARSDLFEKRRELMEAWAAYLAP